MRLKTPCPGCGIVKNRPKADSVCSDCAHAIAEWPKHLAAVNRDKTLTSVHIQKAWHWYPNFYYGGPARPVIVQPVVDPAVTTGPNQVMMLFGMKK